MVVVVVVFVFVFVFVVVVVVVVFVSVFVVVVVVVVAVVVVAVVVVVVVVVAVVDRLLLLLLRLPLPLPLLPHISPHPFTILYTLVWVPTPLIMSNDTRLKAPLAKARGRHSNARPWRDAAKSPLRLVSRGVGAPLLAQN